MSQDNQDNQDNQDSPEAQRKEAWEVVMKEMVAEVSVCKTMADMQKLLLRYYKEGYIDGQLQTTRQYRDALAAQLQKLEAAVSTPNEL